MVPLKTNIGIKSLDPLQSLESCAVARLNFEQAKLQIFGVREFCREGMGIKYSDRMGTGMTAWEFEQKLIPAHL